MHVSNITLSYFMKHDDTSVTIPKRGVVLVTGENGSGKSSVAEGISTAFWGQTLRGTPPWRSDIKGTAIVRADGIEAVRTKTPQGSPKLSWMDESGEKDFKSTSKAQEELEYRIGDWDSWRRTHVFSSQDASHFTTSTDADRKRLLETFLGADRFDPALKACREDLKAKRAELSSTDRELAVLQERLDGARARLADMEEAQELELPPEPTENLEELKERQQKLADMIHGCERDMRGMRNQLTNAKVEVSSAQNRVKTAKEEASRLNRDACPTCGQPIPAKLKKSLQKQVDDAETAAAATADASCELETDLADEIDELVEEERALIQKRDAVLILCNETSHAAQKREGIELQISKLDALRKQLETRIDVVSEQLAEKEELCEELTADVAELEAIEKVLGLSGVRAHVLGRALGGVEAVANSWLARIAGSGLSLKLKPYAEKKTGGVQDKIDLEIEGAGGGFGYKAASGGERRRIDVALLFALGEIAAAAQATTPGTLVLDEVLDTLDGDGVAAVSDAIHELAQNRAVIVVSHSDGVVEALRPDVHLHVEDGHVRAA